MKFWISIKNLSECHQDIACKEGSSGGGQPWDNAHRYCHYDKLCLPKPARNKQNEAPQHYNAFWGGVWREKKQVTKTLEPKWETTLTLCMLTRSSWHVEIHTVIYFSSFAIWEFEFDRNMIHGFPTILRGLVMHIGCFGCSAWWGCKHMFTCVVYTSLSFVCFGYQHRVAAMHSNLYQQAWANLNVSIITSMP